MSDTHASPTTPQARAEEPSPKKMSVFLKVSIVLLIGLTVASISLLFIGDFDGRGQRVFSTFALFAVFVVLTAIDTNRERRNDWYAPVALVANTYILGLLLVVIWCTPFDRYSLLFDIIWKSVFVIVVTRAVILSCELLLRTGGRSGEAAGRFAFGTSALAVLSGILFTAPVGIGVFALTIPDLYWKIATSVLILTALGLSVTLLLRWANRSDERAARRLEQQSVPAYPLPEQGVGVAAGYPVEPAPYAAPAPYGAPAPAQQPVPEQPVPEHAAPEQPAAEQPAPDAPADEAPAQPAPAAEGGLLPWPTFQDGTPIPAGPDGQPDFSVPGAPLPPQF